MSRLACPTSALTTADRSLSGKAVSAHELEIPQRASTGLELEADPLPTDLESFSGTYSNPGYGAVILCTAQSTSHHCLDVLSSFAPFIAQTPFPSPIPAPTAPELYAVWPRLWSSHVRLAHRSAAEFDFRFTSLFPEGYGANVTAFETSESGESEGRAVFVVGGGGEGEGEAAGVLGFGLEIDAEAVEARKRAGAKDVKEWADAWFERV